MIKNSKTQSAIEHLRILQEVFTSQNFDLTSFSVSELDFPTQFSSIRQCAMRIKSRVDPSLQLFHCITPHWQGQGDIFLLSSTPTE